MKIVSDGWIYDVPENAEFIEVTSRDGERAHVECYDIAGEPLPRLVATLLSIVAPVAPWPKRLSTVRA